MLLRRPLSLAQWALGTGPLERYNLNLPSADPLYSEFSEGESLCLMAASPDFSHKNRTECPHNRHKPRALCAISYQSLVPSFFASNIPPAVCSQWTQKPGSREGCALFHQRAFRHYISGVTRCYHLRVFVSRTI